MIDLAAPGPFGDLFKKLASEPDPERVQVWLGTRRPSLYLHSEGLWLPVAAQQGFWATDTAHAEQVARRRGWEPQRAALWQLLAHWPWGLEPREIPILVSESPLGGCLLLPDEDDRRPAREGRGAEEFRWRPVRPLMRPAQLDGGS